MKIAIVTCYDQNDYVRARVLRAAFAACPGVETIVLKNQHKGLLRYLEVPYKILQLRFGERPDAYVITFRGYEMLLYMVLTLVRKPIIFDELVNFEEWMQENKVLKAGTLANRLFSKWYGWQLRHCRFVLADTEAHAKYSSHLSRVPLDQYRTIPVSTDEEVFKPLKRQADGSSFNVFYYGHMKPLHGLKHVIEAAVQLADQPNITFTIVGGKEKTEQACAEAVQQGANLTYKDWIPFEELPKAVQSAGLTLGGPFGGTTQAQYVVTGKTYQFLASAAPVMIGKNKATGEFKDKKNCLLVPQGSTKALVDGILWAKEHPKELQAIGLAGRQLYETKLSQKVINSLVEDIVKDL